MTFLPDVDRRSSALSLLTFVASLITVILTSTPADAAPSYSVVAIKAPYYGTQTPTTWQEVAFPAAIEPRQNLVLIHPNGTEEVLFDCTVGCSVVDPSISFDGKRVYFSVYPNALSAGYNFQRNLPYLGADIYVMDLDTRAVVDSW